jgi:lactoylglutathione lyase
MHSVGGVRKTSRRRVPGRSTGSEPASDDATVDEDVDAAMGGLIEDPRTGPGAPCDAALRVDGSIDRHREEICMPVYNHTGQVVSDLERAKRFYQEVLGFQLWYEMSPPDDMSAKLLGLQPPLGMTTSYLVLDGFILELIAYAADGAQAPYRARTMNEPGLTHISISVDDIRATAERAVEYGGEILEGSDVGAAVFIRDPDGQLLELLSAGYPASRPPKP